MTSNRSLPELGHVVSSCANQLYDFYEDKDIPQPSFARHAQHYSGPFPPAIEARRAQLLEALDELRALIQGPTGHVFSMSFDTPARVAMLQVLYHFEMAKHVPLDEPISYAALAKRCGLSEASTRRYVRAAIAHRIFDEPALGIVQHNAASAQLAKTTLHDWLGFTVEEISPASLHVAESLRRFPAADQPAQSAFALAHGGRGDRDLFALLMAEPRRLARFTTAMDWTMNVPGMEPARTVDSLPWADAAACPRIVVDVGGGAGFLCKALLDRFPAIETAVVEDLPDVVAQQGTSDADSAARARFGARLRFEPYSFFDEQSVRGADVYLWRCVLHDWPDHLAVQLLRNQIPALKTGARLLFNERCLQAPQARSHVSDQFSRSCDIMMGMCANAQERSYDDWVALLATADRRFQVRGVIRPPHAILSIIEVVWTGGEAQPLPPPAAANPLEKPTDVTGSEGDHTHADTGSHDFDFCSEGTTVGDDSPYALSNPTAGPKGDVVDKDAAACKSIQAGDSENRNHNGGDVV